MNYALSMTLLQVLVFSVVVACLIVFVMWLEQMMHNFELEQTEREEFEAKLELDRKVAECMDKLLKEREYEQNSNGL